uniref:(S)-2-hydroxy-acid oxidase n=1 Tax=Lygus hesperus TaxID=30085 RepID=A0A0A9WWN9_LYGHE
MAEQIKNFCCVSEFEQLAKSKLPKNWLDYYNSGACNETTLALNKSAFLKLRIKPRMLRDVSKLDTTTTILGKPVPIPIGVSPTAMQRLACPEGEVANIKAVSSTGSIYILSTLSTTSIEDVALAAPNTTKWFQLYIYKDRDITRNLVQRAEKAGFQALVLTVDAAVFGKRYADCKNKFSLPPHLELANLRGIAPSNFKGSDGSGLQSYVNSLFDSTLTWEDVKWLQGITKMPVILKGILTAEDALIAADLGIPAIVVSNHGGRQLDTCPASIEALPEIARAVGNRCELYLDGGIRYGTDIFKAIALGAKMVFVGRPAVWGLSCAGEDGVKKVLKILMEEFEQAMALSGCTSIGEIRKDMIVHEEEYAKL